jgi:membrane protease YdiL (CAAX protease family)
MFVVFSVYRFFVPVPTSNDPVGYLLHIVAAIIVIMGPSFLYYFFPVSPNKGLSLVDIISGLWVWLPVEFGVLDIWLGKIEFGQIPSTTLLNLFAFMYAIIFIRNHDMGLTFSLNKEDLVYLSKINGIIIVLILPLGVIVNFLATPQIIWENVVRLLKELPGSIVFVASTFLLIFLGIALIEEMFFRGFIQRLLELKFTEDDFHLKWMYIGVIVLVILITITPFVDDILAFLADWNSIFYPLSVIVGSLAKPLGDYEGQSWVLVESIPLELLYFFVALILGTVAIIIIYRTQDPIIAALILSSILFGWAHFDDVRYIFFASIAGAGYGLTYHKTQKIVPAAIIHMIVDAIWSLILTF